MLVVNGIDGVSVNVYEVEAEFTYESKVIYADVIKADEVIYIVTPIKISS